MYGRGRGVLRCMVWSFRGIDAWLCTRSPSITELKRRGLNRRMVVDEESSESFV